MSDILSALCQQRELLAVFCLRLGLMCSRIRLLLQFRTSLNHSKNSFVCDIFTGICGNGCTLCCARSPDSHGFCMRAANGVRLNSAAFCWRLYAFLPTSSSNSAAATRSWSSTSTPTRRTYTGTQDSENEDENHRAVWRGAAIGVVALVVLLAILKRYSPCFKSQTPSQELEEEEEEPITTQAPSDGVPVPGKYAKYVKQIRFHKVCLIEMKSWLLLHPMVKSMWDLKTNIEKTVHYPVILSLYLLM